MITTKNEREFASALLPASLLEAAVGWIQNNLAPEEVFNKQELVDWAQQNGFRLE